MGFAIISSSIISIIIESGTHVVRVGKYSSTTFSDVAMTSLADVTSAFFG